MDRPLTANIDRTLIFLVTVIALLGMYNLSSASKPLGASLHINHGVYLVIGFAVMAVVAAVPYRNYEGLAIPVLILCVTLLLATSGFGKLVNGSRRWLVIGPINIQTSDLAKLAVIVVVARTFHLERWEEGMTLRSIFRPLNVSRPLLLLGVVIAMSLFGDTVRPAKLQYERKARTEQGSSRWISVARLKPGRAPAVIGRAPPEEGGVKLRRSGVADKHAVVTRVGDGEYRLEDLGSAGGTFVNETRVDAPVMLNHGDMIRFGTNQQATLRFRAPTQALRPTLPWLALLGALWLAIAVYVQANRDSWEEQHFIAPIDVVAAPSLLILIQPDLGTTLVVLLIAFSMILYVRRSPT
ncbi:MAG: FtsW/RodA/SpoVE family cell cycle protein, partial [Myxococcota bacterium]